MGLFEYRGIVTRTYDGDSFWCLLDAGGNHRWEPELRLLDVWAPERGQPGAVETTAFVNTWLAGCDGRRKWPLYVVTTLTRTFEPGQRTTFARYLATVWRYGEQPGGVSLNAALREFLAGRPEWGGGSGARAAGGAR